MDMYPDGTITFLLQGMEFEAELLSGTPCVFPSKGLDTFFLYCLLHQFLLLVTEETLCQPFCYLSQGTWSGLLFPSTKRAPKTGDFPAH